MSDVSRAIVDGLDDTDLRRLAERIAPFLPHDDGPEWLTLREAAEYARIGYSTAKRYAADGTWPVERDGGRVYVRRADLDAWRTR